MCAALEKVMGDSSKECVNICSPAVVSDVSVHIVGFF